MPFVNSAPACTLEQTHISVIIASEPMPRQCVIPVIHLPFCAGLQYMCYNETNKKQKHQKYPFQGQFAKSRVSFSRIMTEILNQGVKSTKKLSDSIKKQEKDNFIFCVSQKMNLFKKTKEKRYFRACGLHFQPRRDFFHSFIFSRRSRNFCSVPCVVGI